jgi:hypothetical protein
MRRGWGHERVWGASLATAVLLAGNVAAFAQGTFPFDLEMLLDARPLPGSRRVPILEIGADGRAQVDLWCRSGAAEVVVSGTSIKFTLGTLRENNCTPERARRDEDLAAALTQVTAWRVADDTVTFIGPTELRFRLSSH